MEDSKQRYLYQVFYSMKKINIFLILLGLLISIVIFTILSDRDLRKITKEYLCASLPETYSCSQFYNDYNVRFLPETQMANLDLVKINLTDDYGYSKYFLEIINNNLMIMQADGLIRSIGLDYSNFNKKKIIPRKFASNLNEMVQKGGILDVLFHNNDLYVSYYSKDNSCQRINIAIARNNSEYFDFQNFIQFNECSESSVSGGRLKPYIKDGINGLLLTTSMESFLNMKPQDNDSIYGKILFINLENKSYEIFAKGLRNPQGLLVENDLIISTEHGPRGGDEINRIIYNKNYGWPVSSYGEPYDAMFDQIDFKYVVKDYYKKSHSGHGYEEPLYSFVPSIGISEIIRIPDQFHPKWNTNFFVSSLAGRNIYRVKFDRNYSRVIFSEKIYIGNRIRDLIYSEKLNIIFLALEDYGELGVLRSKTIEGN